MNNGVAPNDELVRVVSCDLAFFIEEPAELALQIAVASSAGALLTEKFDVSVDGSTVDQLQVDELAGPHQSRLHIVQSPMGRLTVSYRAELLASSPLDRSAPSETREETGDYSVFSRYDQTLYLRPSRYCPSDHLSGFAQAEFSAISDDSARREAITEWIHDRIEYVLGSSSVHHSAEDTMLTGVGTCRDFAHLAVALCRAVGVPARFTSVYAPGLSPMDFHAVFETLERGHWYLHDATGLAPRSSMVRIVAGRDAADAAFASVDRGVASLEMIEVSATVGSSLPVDNGSELVELA